MSLFPHPIIAFEIAKQLFFIVMPEHMQAYAITLFYLELVYFKYKILMHSNYFHVHY